MDQPAFSSKRLDHLGIVAGVCKQMRLAQQIDARLPAPARIVSHGEALQAMLLNALGFVSRPLYLTPEFFKNKPLDLLLRPGLLPEHLNDDALGRTLDAFYDHGVTELFAPLAASALDLLGLPGDALHLDTTSFSFHGQYNLDEASQDPDDRHPIHITYGYSCRLGRPPVALTSPLDRLERWNHHQPAGACSLAFLKAPGSSVGRTPGTRLTGRSLSRGRTQAR